MISEKAASTGVSEVGDDMVVRSDEPLNCETPINRLVGGVIVSNEHFYVRNHFPPPRLDPDRWRLEIRGLVRNPLSLRLRDLLSFEAHTTVVTLECAGNGRSRLTPPVDGEQWDLGAVSTAEWTGVLLAHVLDRAGPEPAAREAVFRAADPSQSSRFERSLALDEITSTPILLAYAMNGQPLPIQHGFPLRLIVPGWYAVASVKWLTEVELIDHAFRGHYQTEKYVYEWSRDGTFVREPVRHQRVRSLITYPADAQTVETDPLVIRGLAWSGLAPVANVEVSIDGGRWIEARRIGQADGWSWRRWELMADTRRSGMITIRSRATDQAGRVQPEQIESNRFGYGNNAIQQVTVFAT